MEEVSLGAEFQSEHMLPYKDLVLDLDSQSVWKGEEMISLTRTEFQILELFFSHPKKIYSMENIYQSIWQEEAVGDSTIMVHIKNLRKSWETVRAILSILKQPGERGIMQSKKKRRKLSGEILEFLLVSFLVAAFVFYFLYATSRSDCQYLSGRPGNFSGRNSEPGFSGMAQKYLSGSVCHHLYYPFFVPLQSADFLFNGDYPRR